MTKERIEEFVKLIHDAVEEVKNKNTELAETKEKIEKLAKEIEEKYALLNHAGFITSGSDKVEGDLKSLIEGKPTDEEVKRLQEFNDAWMIAKSAFRDAVPEDVIDKQFREYFKSEFKAFTTVAGSGGDFVPTGFSRTFFEEILVQMQLADLHTVFDMPQNPFKFPIVYHDEMGYLVPENTNDAFTPRTDFISSNTGNLTLNAKKIGGTVVISDELVEDSIVPIADLARKKLITAIAKAIETAIINGDDSATHMDADVTNASDPRKAFKGYRKIGAAGTATLDGGGGAVDGDKLIQLRALMGKYGLNPADLAVVVSPAVYLKYFVNLKDGSGNPLVITRDKYGAQATVLTGELGKIFGIPIVPSAFVREDLNASGVYDGTTTNLTEVLIVNRPAFIIGKRRDVVVRSGKELRTGQTIITADTRIAFATPWEGQNIVGVLYNIAK